MNFCFFVCLFVATSWPIRLECRQTGCFHSVSSRLVSFKNTQLFILFYSVKCSAVTDRSAAVWLYSCREVDQTSPGECDVFINMSLILQQNSFFKIRKNECCDVCLTHTNKSTVCVCVIGVWVCQSALTALLPLLLLLLMYASTIQHALRLPGS